MTLSIAAQLADDVAAGGFQSKALAAIAYQAQAIIGAPASWTPLDLSVARQVMRNPLGFRTIAAWVLVGDATVHATANPTDAVLIAAAASRWPYFASLQQQ